MARSNEKLDHESKITVEKLPYILRHYERFVLDFDIQSLINLLSYQRIEVVEFLQELCFGCCSISCRQERTFSKLNLLLEFGAKLGWLLGVVGQREDVQEPLLYLEDEVVVGVEHLQPILQLLIQLLQG